MMLRNLADRLILFPSRGPDQLAGAVREEVTCTTGVLEFWSARSAAALESKAERLVLCFHGNASRGDREFRRMPRLWGRFPIEFWAVNYPGFGRSSGTAALKSLAAAALAAFDLVESRAEGRPILLAGHSLGTVVALAAAARRKVAGLVLHNPPPLRELILGRYGWWNLWLGAGAVAHGVPKDLNSLANARASTAPALFLLAGQDKLVTPRFQRMVVDAYQGPKRTVDLPAARHNTPVQEEDLATVHPAMDWLWAMGK
jgi:pimeloyl-ACP methyl ester carboxylesterase